MQTTTTTRALESKRISDAVLEFRHPKIGSRCGGLTAILLVLALLLGSIERVAAAQSAQEVGVAAAATTQAVGIPPVSAGPALNPVRNILPD